MRYELVHIKFKIENTSKCQYKMQTSVRITQISKEWFTQEVSSECRTQVGFCDTVEVYLLSRGLGTWMFIFLFPLRHVCQSIYSVLTKLSFSWFKSTTFPAFLPLGKHNVGSSQWMWGIHALLAADRVLPGVTWHEFQSDLQIVATCAGLGGAWARLSFGSRPLPLVLAWAV